MSMERCRCGNQIDTDTDVESYMPWLREHRCKACRFRSIDDAPQDGTVVWLRNDLMDADKPVLAYWATRPPWCNELHGVACEPAWVSLCTSWGHRPPWDEIPSGRLVCPTEWMPA